MFEQKCKDIDISPRFSEMTDMSRLRTCRFLKDMFCYETYLNDYLMTIYKQMLAKVRGGLLDFRTNTGRFQSMSFNERICQVCYPDI